jgi:hypothetical protein
LNPYRGAHLNFPDVGDDEDGEEEEVEEEEEEEEEEDTLEEAASGTQETGQPWKLSSQGCCPPWHKVSLKGLYSITV